MAKITWWRLHAVKPVGNCHANHIGQPQARKSAHLLPTSFLRLATCHTRAFLCIEMTRVFSQLLALDFDCDVAGRPLQALLLRKVCVWCVLRTQGRTSQRKAGSSIEWDCMI